jgi:cell division protein FtsL
MMVRKKYQKKEILLAAACLLLAVATLSFYIWHQAALISLGYQIGKLESDILRLEEDIKKLETQKAALLSLDRVDKIARDQLNLVEPKEDQVIYEDFRVPDGQ